MEPIINKKVYHEYEIIEKFTAGIVLFGSEVKSIKSGNVKMDGSYAFLKNGEMFILNLFIPKYRFSNSAVDEKRTRKLLLRKKEIEKIAGKIQEKGLLIVPLKIFQWKNLIKIEIAIARRLKKWDKREKERKKEENIEIKRALKSGKWLSY